MDVTAEDANTANASNRRRHGRVTRVALAVRFDGQVYVTTNWSMGGFLIDDYDGRLTTGALVTVKGLGRDEAHLSHVNLPARVVRTGEKVIAVSYLGLDATAYGFLQAAMSEMGTMRSLL